MIDIFLEYTNVLYRSKQSINFNKFSRFIRQAQSCYLYYFSSYNLLHKLLKFSESIGSIFNVNISVKVAFRPPKSR